MGHITRWIFEGKQPGEEIDAGFGDKNSKGK